MADTTETTVPTASPAVVDNAATAGDHGTTQGGDTRSLPQDTPINTMTVEELRKECKSLRKQNGLLNCRLLGVNELARLLQEKTEATDTLQDKNKRLELAVVRLENRCSNYEKKAKSQQYSSLPSNVAANSSGKSSQQQSPFIPGPSKQILESLMRENTDLKKTIDSLTKKGPTSYREAVKMNQLEEVIEQKNEKIAILTNQLETLTASQKDESGPADLGSVQRQLIKMEQSMKVKDRFCTLLSERVNQLQRELDESRRGGGIEENDGHATETQLGTLVREHEVKERNMRKMIDELQQQVEKEREGKREAIMQADENRLKLIEKQSEFDDIQNKFTDNASYAESLYNENMSLSKQLDELKSSSSGGGDLKDVTRNQYQREIENRNMQIDQLKRLLEDAQYKYALAVSKGDSSERVGELEEKVKDLEEERLSLEEEISDNKRRIQELQQNNMKLRFGHIINAPPPLRSGGAPITNISSHHGEEVHVDGPNPNSLHDIIKETIRHEVPPINYTSRDVGTDGTTDSATVSTATSTYTTAPPDPAGVRTLPSQSATSNPISSRTSYWTAVGTPVSAPQMYPGSGQVTGHHSAVYQDPSSLRHQYQHVGDSLGYQTHSLPPGSQSHMAAAAAAATGSYQTSQYHPHMGVPRNTGTTSGLGLQRSLSSSPGPYPASSFTTVPPQALPQSGAHSAATIFGGHSTSSQNYFGSGYATTPTAYPPQYPGQPGQRFDISPYYTSGFYSTGGYSGTAGLPPSSSQPTNAGSGVFPSSSGQVQQRRHSPPDPRYGNQQ